ncbi:MAG: hypothetical protein CTY12_07900 [Methylotenera sp.]|nr:MAG: hypothetical protein CTY12_07900 [Methylotenera sp.]
MLIEENPTKYQVFINGIRYGAPQPTVQLAEALLATLTPDQRSLAEVQPVSTDGKQLLFG